MKDSTRLNFTAYEYKEVTVHSDKASLYLDGYESFGWQQDENFPPKETGKKITLRLKRDRKLINRTELTRLQRHFEADMEEISALEQSKHSTATVWALDVALVGTALMTGSVFAATAKPPIMWLCALLGFPAIAGWIAPFFVYQKVYTKKARRTEPFIEQKMEEIYSMCEKGQKLL